MEHKKGHGFAPYEIIFCPTAACNLHCAHCFVTRNDSASGITDKKVGIQFDDKRHDIAAGITDETANARHDDTRNGIAGGIMDTSAKIRNDTHIDNFKRNTLNIEDSIRFLRDCAKASGKEPFTPIEKVGFSGGEPFLALDFVCEICRTAVGLDLMFDNLMTNGVWWKTEDELKAALVRLRDSGFDGKIGLSWDCFHGQSVAKIATFITAVHEIFNDRTSVAIWSVIPRGNEKSDDKTAKGKIAELAKLLGGNASGKTDKKTGCGELVISSSPENQSRVQNHLHIPIYRFSESIMPQKIQKWTDKKWFTEDFCEATGQVLYVHANGKIAPCCGFANECEPLIIGTINDSYATIMKNAAENQLVRICFEEGLSSLIKQAKKAKRLLKKTQNPQKAKRTKLPKKEFFEGDFSETLVFESMPNGKTNDICQFCAWVANGIVNSEARTKKIAPNSVSEKGDFKSFS